MNEEPSKPSLGIKQVISSVAAALLGVQSDDNRKRDFSEGKFSHFAIVGGIAVTLFVLALIAIVQIVLSLT
ncbi:DUF2970 domain-containing protein [Thalassotalea sp. HSM 43]|uniref:DUF2970 domain-containing protein n=1 Tax=Thalassotalea sp. HSM 43 TaxID=2552945 RepID=UPI00107FDC1F|nr:DUF2970 domain-containing protein [Thalassotalea sp. HSM 43]QBY04683.1 DUF2970 domain-containing protein [Thalassotalea sp. HSM 43]